MIETKSRVDENSASAGRDVALLRALNAATTTLQRSVHSEAEVFKATRDVMAALGVRGSLALLNDSGDRFIIRAVYMAGGVLPEIERISGLRAEGYEVPFSRSEAYQQVIHNGRAIYAAKANEVERQLIPAYLRPVAERILALFGRGAGIYAPIILGGQARGVLCLAGTNLRQEDTPAIEIFANHISAALENARLFAATQQAEAQYRRLFESASNGIIVIDPQSGRIVSANPRALEITGRSEAQLIGATMTELHPGAALACAEELPELLRRGGHADLEIALAHPDGQVAAVQLSKTIFEVNGRPMIQCVMHDVTERVQAEKVQSALYRIAALASADISLEELYRSIHAIVGELMHAENFFIALYEAQDDLIHLPYFVDEADTYSGPYPAGKGLTEYVMRTGIGQLIDTAQYEILSQEGEVELVGTDSPIWLGVPLKVKGETMGAVVVQHYRDETAYTERDKQVLSFVSDQIATAIWRKQAEEKLRRAEAELRRVMGSISDYVWSAEVDSHQQVISRYFSPVVEKITGRPPAYYTAGQGRWLSVVHPEDRGRAEQIDNRVLRGQSAREEFEYRVVWPDGTIRWVRDSMNATRLENGHIHLFGIVSDITERKQVEEALRQTQKLESLGVLAGGVAHDFNNLLVAMLGQASLALAQLPAGHPARDNLEKAVKAAQRAADVTRQLLAYSGRGQFEIRCVQLNTLVKENLPLLEVAIAKNVSLHANLRQPLPPVEGDVGQLQQVLMNLIINAAEAIGSRPGKVVVSTGCQEVAGEAEHLRRFTGQPLEPGRYVTLSVSDNGNGIEPDMLSRIFDPFYTTKFTGRGLGLAAVLGIVRGHQGGLLVESALGQGTTFKLYFPAAVVPAEEPAGVALHTPPLAASANGQTPAAPLVLVIDDEGPVREAVTDILALADIAVMAARDGREGLRLYQQHQRDVQLVLLDLSMPGMNGEETFAQLRQMNPLVRVLLSSGYSEVEATHRFGSQGPAGFLQKPYSAEGLLATVKRHLA